VARRSFLGERVQLRLALDDQPAQLLADVERDSPWREGDQVGIRIPPESLIPAIESAAA
jgi:putative spermidine/putrescine transport system ATP-binding protein